MKQREKINKKIESNISKIKALNDENVRLRIRELQISDKTQQYSEKMEVRGRGKTKQDVLVGRVHWKEDFKDEDTGEVVTVERQTIVRIGETWYEVNSLH